MDPQELIAFKNIVEEFLYLEFADLKSAIDSNRYNTKKLNEAFDVVEIMYLKEGRKEDYSLLQYVREILKERLLQSANNRPGEILSTKELLIAGLNAPNSIRLRTLLKRYVHFIDEEFMKELQYQAASPTVEQQENYLKLFYVAALVYNVPKWRIVSSLLWSSLLRRYHLFSKAERYLQLARDIEALHHTGSEYLIMSSQVGLYSATRNLSKALEILEEMQFSRETVEDRTKQMNLHMAAAEIARNLGQLYKSLDHLIILVELLGQEDDRFIEYKIRAYELRGLVNEDLGRYDKGFSDYQVAAELSRTIGDKDSQFINMNNMAASYSKRNLHQEALDKFKEILQTVSTWGNPVLKASTHNNIGSILLQMDRPAEALLYYQKAFKIKINSGDKKGEAISLFGIADTLEAMGETEDAKSYITLASMPVLESNDPGLIFQYATRIRKDALDESMGTIKWALNVVRQERNAFMESALLNQMYRLLSTVGRREEVFDQYETFFKTHRDFPAISPVYVTAICNYANLLAEEKNARKPALGLLEKALQSVQNEVEEVLNDERRAEIISASLDLHSTMIKILLDEETYGDAHYGNHLHAAFDLHESAKSRSFLRNLADAPLPSSNIPGELIEEETRLLRLEQSYEEQDDPKSEEYRAKKVLEIRSDLQGCWEKMKYYNGDYVRYRSGEPYTYKEIQDALFKGEQLPVVFVSFFCNEDSTTAFVFRRSEDRPSIFRSDIGNIELSKIASRLQRAFNGDPNEFPPYPPILREKPEARSLDFFYKLSKALLSFLGKVREEEIICIAPHGPLHLIPFHALKTPDGAFLASRHAVVYTPSLSTLMLQFVSSGFQKKQQHNGKSILVAGISAEDDLNPQFFEQDVEIFDKQNASVNSRTGTKKANRSETLADIPVHDIVHLSCHGFFDAKNPLHSGLLFSDGFRKPPANPKAIPVMYRNRFLIRVKDILKLRMKAQVFSLNACSTGIQGQKNRGDEMEGFNRSLLLSGASSVIVTLWNVDQQSSIQFFKSFYNKILTKGSTLEKWKAFHLAQCEFIQSENKFLQHPYHWAAFTLNGNWK